MTVPEIWVVEQYDHNSDDTTALAHTAEQGIADAYAERLAPLLSRQSGVRCYRVPLLTQVPEPFTAYSLVYRIGPDGRGGQTHDYSHLILAQDAPEAANYPAEPAVRVWRPGEDGGRQNRENWVIVGYGRDRGLLEHRCRLEYLAVLAKGRTEEHHRRPVAEHACPECERPAHWGCTFDVPKGSEFHPARVEAMEQEARRRAAAWRERELPLWAEVRDPDDRWWER